MIFNETRLLARIRTSYRRHLAGSPGVGCRYAFFRTLAWRYDLTLEKLQDILDLEKPL